MFRTGTLSIQKRTSQKTGNPYTALVFTFEDGAEILIFDEKVKAAFLQHIVESMDNEMEDEE